MEAHEALDLKLYKTRLSLNDGVSEVIRVLNHLRFFTLGCKQASFIFSTLCSHRWHFCVSQNASCYVVSFHAPYSPLMQGK